MFQELIVRFAKSRRQQSWMTIALAAGLLASLIPGSGLRTTWVHLRHWNDLNYNAPKFAQSLIADLPPDAKFTVDTQFALDFVAAGRRAILAETLPAFIRAEQFPYDYLIISRRGLETGISERMCSEEIRAVGIADDPFACFAEIHQPASQPCP
jgi:hypothetical protein